MIAILLALLAVVNSPYSPPTYACNGVTAVFTVNFPYRASTDLVLTSSTAGVLVLTTDYTVSLISSTTTASVTLTNPAVKCPSGTLKITRATSPPQKYAFGQQTTFNTQTLELSEDAIVYQVQEAANLIGSSGVAGTVTADVPLTGNGSATSHLAIPKATAAVDGYLFKTDWTTFNNKAATGSCAANNFVISDSSSGVTCAQPVVANISDIATNYVQLQATTPGSAQVGNANLTGKLILAPSVAATTALVATGSTTGAGALLTGGASGGAGTTSQGGASSGIGTVSAGGAPAGTGSTSTGGNNPAGIAGIGAVISAGVSQGNGVNGAKALALQGGVGQPATVAGTGGGFGGNSIDGTSGAGGAGNTTGTGGGGADVFNAVSVGAGGTGGSTGAGGTGGRVLKGIGGAGGTGGATSGVGGAGSGGLASGAIDVQGGVGGSPGTTTGTAGGGGNAAVLTGGAGGSTLGAGTGGTGGIGTIGVGGNGGATVGGTGGTGGAGGSHTGGNGAASNGSGGQGDVITGGNAVGTGQNGSGATIASGSGGTGTGGAGFVLQLLQANAVRSYINFGSARAAVPTTLVNGDFGTINDGSATTSVMYWQAGATTKSVLTTGTNVTDNAITLVPSGTGSLTHSSTAATARAGYRSGDTRVVSRTTNATPPDCAAATLNLTVTQFLDVGIFTCATAQTANFPTWQGASGIVQGLPGTPVVGDIIGPITCVPTAANAITLGFGTGGTNGSGGTTCPASTTRHIYCRLTSVTGGSETATCY